MAEVKSSKPRRTSLRTGRFSLNPYVVDEIAPTLAEIRRARGDLPAAVAAPEMGQPLAEQMTVISDGTRV